MSENYDMNKARSVYNALINMLNTRDWKYQPDDENMLIRSGIKGEDLPIEFVMIVNPRNEVVQFLSALGPGSVSTWPVIFRINIPRAARPAEQAGNQPPWPRAEPDGEERDPNPFYSGECLGMAWLCGL